MRPQGVESRIRDLQHQLECESEHLQRCKVRKENIERMKAIRELLREIKMILRRGPLEDFLDEFLTKMEVCLDKIIQRKKHQEMFKKTRKLFRRMTS